MTYRLLDLFCGAGGAAMGYHRAGFEVVGVDIQPQPHYPFKFHQADALTFPLEGFDAIHGSPPCQAFTQMSAKYRGRGGLADSHPDLLTPTLARLRQLALPWVVENVPGARRFMRTTLVLHGGMFSLGVHRPRRFESNVIVLCPKSPMTAEPVGVYGRMDGRRLWTRNNGNYKTAAIPRKSIIRAARTLDEAGTVMDIDWMDWSEIKEAIPPAYTEWIGRQLMAYLERAA